MIRRRQVLTAFFIWFISTSIIFYLPCFWKRGNVNTVLKMKSHSLLVTFLISVLCLVFRPIFRGRRKVLRCLFSKICYMKLIDERAAFLMLENKFLCFILILILIWKKTLANAVLKVKVLQWDITEIKIFTGRKLVYEQKSNKVWKLKFVSNFYLKHFILQCIRKRFIQMLKDLRTKVREKGNGYLLVFSQSVFDDERIKLK